MNQNIVLAGKSAEELAAIREQASINLEQAQFDLAQLPKRAKAQTDQKNIELARIPVQLQKDTDQKSAQVAIIASNIAAVDAAIAALPA